MTLVFTSGPSGAYIPTIRGSEDGLFRISADASSPILETTVSAVNAVDSIGIGDSVLTIEEVGSVPVLTVTS